VEPIKGPLYVYDDKIKAPHYTNYMWSFYFYIVLKKYYIKNIKIIFKGDFYEIQGVAR